MRVLVRTAFKFLRSAWSVPSVKPELMSKVILVGSRFVSSSQDMIVQQVGALSLGILSFFSAASVSFWFTLARSPKNHLGEMSDTIT